MALWLARGTVLARIRAQSLTLGGGRLRSLSAGTCDQIKTKHLDQISSSLRFLSANPIEMSDGEINSLTSYVTTRLDESIKSASLPHPLIFGAEVFVNTDSIFKTCSDNVRLEIMLLVADVLQNLPQVDKIQIYHAKLYYGSMLYDDYGDNLSICRIIESVLSVIQTFPKVGDYKVAEETHFFKDLGFDKWDFIDIIQALQVLFKLYIPYEVVSCKLAIEYIYDHRMERLSVEEFRKHLFITGEFGESKSEFRRIFLPGKEKRKNGVKSDLDCRALSFNGFKAYKYFKNMKSQFYCDLSE